MVSFATDRDDLCIAADRSAAALPKLNAPTFIGKAKLARCGGAEQGRLKECAMRVLVPNVATSQHFAV
jgi:hypothetical protein